MTGFNESAVEQAALAWLESIGWPAKLGSASLAGSAGVSPASATFTPIPLPVE